MAKPTGLGRGLDLLFEDNSTEMPEESSGIKTLRLSDIEPNKEQPRTNFEEEKINELAASIKENGLIEPITVRPISGGVYQIIAGERRWRACKLAGLIEAPVIIMDVSDEKAMLLTLIENLQREDLSPLEEARGYKAIMDRYNWTQEQVAQKTGKSRPVVANAVRLLTLPDYITSALENKEITAGHARVLAGIEDGEKLSDVFHRIIAKNLSVRETEKAAKEETKIKTPTITETKKWGTDTLVNQMVLALQESIGRKVSISRSGKAGSVNIEFFDDDDLNTLINKLETLSK